MRALAILGPNARERDLAPFRATGAEISPVAELANSEGANAVLVLGGDGTVQRQLAALVRTRLPLLVVPAGSANDFARALQLRTSAQALQAWKRFLSAGDNVRQIDVGVLRRPGAADSYFCCAAGAGVDAEAARRANALPHWLRGHGGYFLAALPALLRFRPQTITLTAPQRVLAEFGILAAAANAPWYGHGMRIAPRAELDDGQLEICFVRAMGKLRLLRLFPTVYRGRHVGLPQVEYFRAARLRIESEKPLPVHADGEPAGTTPVELSLLPRALRVIAGNSSEQSELTADS